MNYETCIHMYKYMNYEYSYIYVLRIFINKALLNNHVNIYFMYLNYERKVTGKEGTK